MKKLIIISIVVVALSIVAVPSALFGDPVEKVDAFVCPVFNENVGAKNPNTFPIAGGDYSLLPGKAGGPEGPNHSDSPVSVPIHATNSWNGGTGNGGPGGPHSAPGEGGYSPIWNLDH